MDQLQIYYKLLSIETNVKYKVSDTATVHETYDEKTLIRGGNGVYYIMEDIDQTPKPPLLQE
jgi:hypothetical protein